MIRCSSCMIVWSTCLFPFVFYMFDVLCYMFLCLLGLCARMCIYPVYLISEMITYTYIYIYIVCVFFVVDPFSIVFYVVMLSVSPLSVPIVIVIRVLLLNYVCSCLVPIAVVFIPLCFVCVPSHFPQPHNVCVAVVIQSC